MQSEQIPAVNLVNEKIQASDKRTDQLRKVGVSYGESREKRIRSTSTRRYVFVYILVVGTVFDVGFLLLVLLDITLWNGSIENEEALQESSK